MPTREVPLRDVADVRKLRRNDDFITDAKELVRLCDESKEIEAQIDEIRPRLLGPLKDALNEDEKSVRLDGHRLTVVTPEKGRKYLDTKKLLKYISVKTLEKCYSETEPGKPYVQVVAVVDKSQKARATKKLRRGMDDDE